MICQNCGREAATEAKFCVECGSPLVLRCPACQTAYDLGSRFCSLCGRSLPESVNSAPENKQEQTEVTEPVRETHRTELPSQFEEPAPAASQFYPCPRCHQKNSSDAEYCFACGMPIENPYDSSHSSATSIGMASEEPAGFFVRLIAYLIDNVLAFVCVSIAVGLFASPDELSEFNSDIVGAAFLGLGIWVGYFTILIATRATTVGKSFFGLYVVRSDGSKVGLLRALTRSMTLLLVLALAYGTVLGLFLLVIPYVRTLHDHICDTRVVRRRRQMS